MKSQLPKCPVCGTNAGTVAQGEMFFCRRCNGLFDGDPNEGGDYSDRNPGARLERDEAPRTRPKPTLGSRRRKR